MASKRGKIVPVTAAQAVGRAKAAAAANLTKYKLGAGGKDPEGYPGATSDCVGFTCWASGIDRYQVGNFPVYDGWINTDSAIEEAERKYTAKKPQAKLSFKSLGPDEKVQPGDWVCFPSISMAGKRARIGHVGIITNCHGDETRIDLAGIEVVHCSPANEVHGDDAVGFGYAGTWVFGTYRKEFRGKVYPNKYTRVLRPLWYLPNA